MTGVGTVLDGSEGGSDSIAIFPVLQSSFWLDPIALSLGDSYLKVRHGKEVWGCPRMPSVKRSCFWSSDLLFRIEGQ